MLDDPADPVRLQAAYYLSLLRDPQTEPAVAQVFRSVQEGRLAAAPLHEVGKVWVLGPFADGEKGFQTPHAPEQGAVESGGGVPGGGRQENDVAGAEGGRRPVRRGPSFRAATATPLTSSSACKAARGSRCCC